MLLLQNASCLHVHQYSREFRHVQSSFEPVQRRTMHRNLPETQDDTHQVSYLCSNAKSELSFRITLNLSSTNFKQFSCGMSVSDASDIFL